MKTILVRENILAHLKYAFTCFKSPRGLLLPKNLENKPLSELLIQEGIAHYQTEIDYLDERVVALEKRKEALEPYLEYEYEQRTGWPIPIGPQPYLAAVDSISSASKLRISLVKALEELRNGETGPSNSVLKESPLKIKQVLEGFEIIEAPKTDFTVCIEIQYDGCVKDSTSRLAERRQKPMPFIEYERRANAKAEKLHEENRND